MKIRESKFTFPSVTFVTQYPHPSASESYCHLSGTETDLCKRWNCH